MSNDTKQQSLLTFRVGPVLCCAPSLPVRSIISPPKLTHPPGSDSSQPGIFKHGSHIVKVLDLRQKFGIDESQQTQPGNLIITIFEKESFAFWVDQILDVFNFPSEGWGNLPAAIPRGIFTRTLVLNKKIHLYSEFENLSTIHDLGYLKHYILQLQKQEDKELKIVDTKNIAENKVMKISRSEITSTITVKKSSEAISPTKEKVVDDKQTTQLETYTKEGDKQPTVLSNKTSVQQSPLSDKNTQQQKSPDSIPIHSENVTKKTTSSSVEAALPTSIKITSEEPKATIKNKRKHIQPKTYENKNIIGTDDKSSVGFIAIVFLIIVGIFSFGAYYLLSGNLSYSSQFKEPEGISPEPIVLPMKSIESIETSKDEETTSEITTLIDSEKNKYEDNKITDVETNIEEYRAEIIQQDDEITITIHQPNSEKLATLEIKKEIAVTEQIDTKVIIETLPIEILKQEEITVPVKTKKIITEVIHIVVKGDTLWAIAKKYVDDPFLYPELARLSKIKNPNRIYPGNRVRIRFITN